MAEEQFVPGEQAKLDLESLDARPGVGGQSNLVRDSLYVKFDPLVGSQDSPAKAPAVAADPATPVAASTKLLDMDTPKGCTPTHTAIGSDFLTGDATPTITMKRKSPSAADAAAASPASTQAGGATYTEEDLQKKIQEALQQSNEEMSIMQMEVEDLQGKLKQEQQNNAQMTQVVDEYGQAMAKMVESQESNQAGLSEQVKKLIKEKELAEIDLAKTETAFSDLHRKYEKTKEIVVNYKKNEEALRTTLETAQGSVKGAETRYDALKAHAEQKIQEANQEINNVREQFKAQISVLSAKLKKSELELGQLQRQLEAKDRDNKELTGICDDLVKQLDALTSGSS